MPVVLVEPQIPQNTGSIARSCAALQTPLHVIKPIPFEISEKSVRRAGLDYWPFVDLYLHESWEDFLGSTPGARENCWFFTTKGTLKYWEARLTLKDFFVFGSETRGLGQQFLSSVPEERILTIPMLSENVRSLNLSNAASIILYDALRQGGESV